MSITKGKIIGLIISFAVCIILIASGIIILSENKTHTLHEYTLYNTELNGDFETVIFNPSESRTYFLYVDGCDISNIKSSSKTVSLTNYVTNIYKNGTYFDYRYEIKLTGGITYTITTTASYNEITLYIC